MIKLLSVVFVSVILAELSQYRGKELKKQGKKEKFFYSALVIFLILFAGLRYEYNDTHIYIGTYNSDVETPILSIFLKEKFDFLGYWGYGFCKSLMKTFRFDSQMYIMVMTAFPVIIYLWFIRKYAEEYFPLAVLLFITNGYTLLWAASKQVIATAIAMIAIDRLCKKKYLTFLVWLFIATLFHPSAWGYLLVPLFLNVKPWTRRTYLFITVLAVLGAGMQVTGAALGRVFGYDVEEILHHTVDPLRFIATAAPAAVSFLYRKQLYCDSSKEEDLIFHLNICEIMFMFWALFGNPILLARVSNLFSMGNWLSLSWMLGKLKKNKTTAKVSQLVRIVACICYIIVFVYEFYSFGGVDKVFRQISLGDFLRITLKWVGEH